MKNLIRPRDTSYLRTTMNYSAETGECKIHTMEWAVDDIQLIFAYMLGWWPDLEDITYLDGNKENLKWVNLNVKPSTKWAS